MFDRVKLVLKLFIPRVLLTLWQRFYWWNKRRLRPYLTQRIIKRILSKNREVKLELGAAKRVGMEDWIASDINGYGDIRMDFTKPIPFPDNSVDRIYSSHVLEHFSYPTPMIPFLKECHRILKQGGEFSVCVPNAEVFINGYNNPSQFDKEKFCAWDVGLSYETPIDFINFIAYLGEEHKHLFDKRNLPLVLAEAGFNNVSLRDFDSSVDMLVRRDESIYALAFK